MGKRDKKAPENLWKLIKGILWIVLAQKWLFIYNSIRHNFLLVGLFC